MTFALLIYLALLFVGFTNPARSASSSSYKEIEANRYVASQDETLKQTPIQLFGRLMAPNWQPPSVAAETSQNGAMQHDQAQNYEDFSSNKDQSKSKLRYKLIGSELGKNPYGWYSVHTKEEAQKIRELIMYLHKSEVWTDYYNAKAKQLTPEERRLALEGDEKLRSRLGPLKRGHPITMWNQLAVKALSFEKGQSSSNPSKRHGQQQQHRHAHHHQDHRA